MNHAAMPPRPNRLPTVLPYKVARLHAQYTRLLTRVSEENGLTLQQWKVFSALGSFEPIAASEVCRWLTTDKAIVSRVVRQLLERKLVKRRLHARDARLVEILLTQSGKALYAKMAAALDSVEAELLMDSDSSEIQSFHSILERLEARLSELNRAAESEASGAVRLAQR